MRSVCILKKWMWLIGVIAIIILLAKSSMVSPTLAAVTGIDVMNVMHISVAERTEEIAIRRAL